jgi:hypothetical protein
MRLTQFLLGTLLAGLATLFFTGWARNEIEAQIGMMQLNAYNSPGAELPVPPTVFAAGGGLLLMLWLALRKGLGMRILPALMALLLGGGGGVATLLALSPDQNG